MRVARVLVSANAPSPWVPVNRLQQSFSVDLGVLFHTGASLTVKAQYTLDILQPQTCTWTRSGTTLTVNLPNHGLSTADSVIAQELAAGLDGTYTPASIVDANNFTLTVTDTGPLGGQGKFTPLRVFDHASLTGLTARASGSLGSPVSAVRLIPTAYVSGIAELVVSQARG
ncbi:MAG: hypothetical protein SFV24_19190 [Gemmatimonadales bacterium]|nr:hypothetical protein [Gemmatimonadales bacterium]